MIDTRADEAVLGSRIRGCVLGGAIGDALGAPIEFDSLERLRDRYGPQALQDLECSNGVALITDDTQMTLFGIEGLIRHQVRQAHQATGTVEAAVRRAYQRWLGTQVERVRYGDHATGWLREQEWLYHRRAPGNACLSGLRQPGDGIEGFTGWGRPGPINSDSKGCGSVMRSAPFGLAGTDATEIFEVAARCAMYTHGHPTGYLAAGAFAVIVHKLTLGLPPAAAVAQSLELLTGYPGHDETGHALRAAVALADQGGPTPERVESLGGGWVAEEALAIAVYCALVEQPGHDERPSAMKRALLLSVNHSGDSDSTGAICGNLLGAACGFEALPAEWLVKLEHRAELTEVADDLALSIRGGRRLALDSRHWNAKYPG